MSETTIRNLNSIRRIQKGVTVKKAMSMVIAVVMLMSGQAGASLIGSPVNFTLNHNLGGFTNIGHGGIHTYGSTELFNSDLAGGTPQIALDSSLPPLAGFNNRITFDVTEIRYDTMIFVTEVDLSITGLIEPMDMASVKVLANNIEVGTALTSLDANSFAVHWNNTDVLAAFGIIPDPAPTGPAPVITIDLVWNSVPGPGVLTMLGVGGMVSRRRRRA